MKPALKLADPLLTHLLICRLNSNAGSVKPTLLYTINLGLSTERSLLMRTSSCSITELDGCLWLIQVYNRINIYIELDGCQWLIQVYNRIDITEPDGCLWLILTNK